ncbi:hypothetical protein [Dactylosporangium sp. CA-092794]|uniref:hypothetical protein n=1 Tax=Dactylosporangium sp. CA-092794 TaxID=3239929 RepID=UPI003D8A445D
MAKWVVVVSSEEYAAERVYGTLDISVQPGVLGVGDEALLVVGGDDDVVFGVARVDGAGRLQYTVNLLDSPLAAGGLGGDGSPGVRAVDQAAYSLAVERVRQGPVAKRTWLVSVDMPIEAGSPGEAVRVFWNYVRELGPAELPAFVWPAGDELAMQAFVLGAEANQDPEEE